MELLERHLQSVPTYLRKSRQGGGSFLHSWGAMKIVVAVASFSLAVATLARLVESNLVPQELGVALTLVGTVLPALAWINFNFIV
ncbi:MAG TPA: hypothetical protein VFN26_03795 [Candidatus Acidoferrum sp.]|nr:hypothetical protein [Candidatus Acidoferrum sp.]